jgi:hypothetical protein
MDPAAFVLRDFSAAERKELPFLIDRAATRWKPCSVPGSPRRRTYPQRVIDDRRVNT